MASDPQPESAPDAQSALPPEQPPAAPAEAAAAPAAVRAKRFLSRPKRAWLVPAVAFVIGAALGGGVGVVAVDHHDHSRDVRHKVDQRWRGNDKGDAPRWKKNMGERRPTKDRGDQKWKNRPMPGQRDWQPPKQERTVPGGKSTTPTPQGGAGTPGQGAPATPQG